MLFKLRFLTAGESHGQALTGILEGLPSGIPLSSKDIQNQMSRRQLGFGRGKRMQIESDQVEILSGVRHGLTLGSPIGLLLPNRDWDNWKYKMSISPSENPPTKVTLPRPGHADLAGVQKYGFDDIRNVLERSSARETAMRNALGAVCRKLLSELDIQIASRVIQIHSARDTDEVNPTLPLMEMNRLTDASSVRCLNPTAARAMEAAVKSAMETGDSVGGVFEIRAAGLPAGLGNYTHWDRKLTARLSAAVMSVNAVKGIEFGAGFRYAQNKGSQMHDEMILDGDKLCRPTNNAGGLEGGMTNGEPLVFRAVMKPIPTLRKPLRSVDIASGEEKKAHRERTDTCTVPAAAVIAEQMTALVLADALLEKFGGDSLVQLKEHMALTAAVSRPAAPITKDV